MIADDAQGAKGSSRGDRPELRVFCVTLDVVEERRIMRRRALDDDLRNDIKRRISTGEQLEVRQDKVYTCNEGGICGTPHSTIHSQEEQECIHDTTHLMYEHFPVPESCFLLLVT